MKKHFFLAAAVLLSAGVATTSCSNEELVQTEQKKSEGTSYMSLLIGLPQMGGTRTAQDGQDNPNPDFNHIGKWAGKDHIKNLSVYVFKGEGDAATLEKVEQFEEGQFELQQPYAGSTQAFIKPLKGIQITPGKKQVVVVVNGKKAKLDALFTPTPDNTTLQMFNAKLASADFTFQPQSPVAAGGAAQLETVADEIAKVNDQKQDEVLMTGVVSAAVDVKDGITEKTTLNSPDVNRAQVTVQRAVARVLVTSKEASYEIMGDDPMTPNAVEKNIPIGSFSDLKFVVAQGERRFFFTQQSANNAAWAFRTPASDFVPGKADKAVDQYHTADGADALTASESYDYSGLWRNYEANKAFGIAVATADLNNFDLLKAELDKGMAGEFLLPNTHKYAAAPAEGQAYTGDYRKGNTAYVLVRGIFKPKFVTNGAGVSKAVTDDQVATEFPGFAAGQIGAKNYDAAQVEGTFVLGSNGKFYKNFEDAQTHVPGMECQLFKGGVMLYYAWINPDLTTSTDANAAPRWFNSPIIRNNIYHIRIKGIKSLGINWNPLVPGDPTQPNGTPGTPGGPGAGTPGLPSNPDPRPKNPFEPKTPPVNPNDDLTPKDTWMSVETKILPWEVHSYELDLR